MELSIFLVDFHLRLVWLRPHFLMLQLLLHFPFNSFEDSKTTVPPLSVVIESSSAVPEAAPPMWNVLMVSCVPGSPIDCAATTPTASPM